MPGILRRAGAVILFAGAAALLPALSAAAEEPVDFGGSDIADAADILSPADEGRVQDALDDLQQDTGVTLLVAYIDEPENPSNIAAWSTQVVSDNGLGANNALLVIAVDVRQYYFDEGLNLTDAERSAVERDGLLPALGRDDWAGGAIGAAEQLAAVLTGDEPASGGAGASPGFSFNPLPALLIIGGFVLVLVLVARILSARRKRAALRAQQEDQKQLDLRAGGLLVELDDALKTSEQELGFAEAEFGAEQTAAFRTTLVSAQQKVREAFRIKQQLDDAQPETPEQRRELSSRIIALCEEADAELDAQAEEFDKLRELGRRAPEALAAMTTEAEAIDARLPAAEAALANLSTRYAAAALADIAGNPDQARKLLSFAASEGGHAAESIRAGQGAAAAVAVRGAQQSLDQARTLLDAVERADADLAAALEQLDGEIGDLRSDIADARALPTASAAPELPQLVAEAEQALQAATRGETRRDPVAAVIALAALEQRVDAALGPAREQAARRQRAEAALARALQSSRAQLAAANE
ncbi:MAG: hypothetical protein JWP66_1487, partial [Naasia sp.]|nr:hypothetical protein [Naasia sp.]